MYASIDWFSFTIPWGSPISGGGEETQRLILQKIELLWGQDYAPIITGGQWELEKGRGFYQFRIREAKSKITMSWGDINPHVYVECSGQACLYLSACSLLEDLIQKEPMRTSRIDFAVDFETDVQPQEFILNNEGKAFKTQGHIRSEDGETCYVGSRKGERFARVYRYHPPHPRSHLLRVEAEYKGDAAKIAASQISEGNMKEVCLSAHVPFGWSHPLWQTVVGGAEPLPARFVERGEPSRLRWLYGTVGRSLHQSIRDGLIQLPAWLEATGLDQWLQTKQVPPSSPLT